MAAADPELAEARSRWMRQLLDTKLDQPEEALKLALRGAEAAPGEEELWGVAEEMARKLNRPEPVAEAYTRTIERDLPPAVAETVGRRVVEFQEEWFDDDERVIALLGARAVAVPDRGLGVRSLEAGVQRAGSLRRAVRAVRRAPGA